MIHCGMKLALIAALTVGNPLGVAPTSRGFAVYYPSGLFERVAANRGMTPAACMAATSRLPLGRWIDVRGLRTGQRRRCKVLDICAPVDCPALRRRKIVVELDQASNLAICGHLNEPARMCPVTVTEGRP